MSIIKGNGRPPSRPFSSPTSPSHPILSIRLPSRPLPTVSFLDPSPHLSSSHPLTTLSTSPSISVHSVSLTAPFLFFSHPFHSIHFPFPSPPPRSISSLSAVSTRPVVPLLSFHTITSRTTSRRLPSPSAFLLSSLTSQSDHCTNANKTPQPVLPLSFDIH